MSAGQDMYLQTCEENDRDCSGERFYPVPRLELKTMVQAVSPKSSKAVTEEFHMEVNRYRTHIKPTAKRTRSCRKDEERRQTQSK